MIQTLINLIENSIKFWKNCPNPQIVITIYPEGRWIRIDVSDTGPGIPKYALKKVFDDFYGVDNPITKSTRGTGIGLAFVKKAIQAVETPCQLQIMTVLDVPFRFVFQ